MPHRQDNGPTSEDSPIQLPTHLQEVFHREEVLVNRNKEMLDRFDTFFKKMAIEDKEKWDDTNGLRLLHDPGDWVRREIGPIASPDAIQWAPGLPKTRSGKIMRRLLRDIAEGKAIGDTTTLADPNVVAKLKAQYESQEE